jgi:hypothetical protein
MLLGASIDACIGAVRADLAPQMVIIAVTLKKLDRATGSLSLIPGDAEPGEAASIITQVDASAWLASAKKVRSKTKSPRNGRGYSAAKAARRLATVVILKRLGRLAAASASFRLIIPGVLSLRANGLLDRTKLQRTVDDRRAVRRPLPTVTGIAARLADYRTKTHNVAIALLLQRAGLSAHDLMAGSSASQLHLRASF